MKKLKLTNPEILIADEAQQAAATMANLIFHWCNSVPAMVIDTILVWRRYGPVQAMVPHIVQGFSVYKMIQTMTHSFGPQFHGNLSEARANLQQAASRLSRNAEAV